MFLNGTYAPRNPFRRWAVLRAPERRGPVVVALADADVNADVDADPAVEWGAAEASVRRCELQVVRVERLRWTVDPAGMVPVADLWSRRAVAERAVAGAVARARSAFPDVEVSGLVLSGSPARVLASRSRSARLLVLGSGWTPDRRRLPSVVTTSLGASVVQRARCPVAMVRRLGGETPGRSFPRVVVGVGLSAASAGAVGFAFRAAAQRGVSLTAVHAWAPDLPADHESVCGSPAGSEAAARRRLASALAPWTTRFAGVPVESCLVMGDPAAALVEASDGAALVVVGVRGRAPAVARLLGTVHRRLVREARCPLVAVRVAGTTEGLGALARRPASPVPGDEEMDGGGVRWR
jgi:nucleotide-binding universal stress UspA family protein